MTLTSLRRVFGTQAENAGYVDLAYNGRGLLYNYQNIAVSFERYKGPVSKRVATSSPVWDGLPPMEQMGVWSGTDKTS